MWSQSSRGCKNSHSHGETESANRHSRFNAKNKQRENSVFCRFCELFQPTSPTGQIRERSLNCNMATWRRLIVIIVVVAKFRTAYEWLIITTTTATRLMMALGQLQWHFNVQMIITLLTKTTGIPWLEVGAKFWSLRAGIALGNEQKKQASTHKKRRRWRKKESS